MRVLLDVTPLGRIVDSLGLDNRGRTLAVGAATSFGINVAGMALGFVVQLVLARAVGAEQFGLYLLVMAWLNTALLAGKLELDIVTIRFVGAYVAQQRWSLLRGVRRRMFGIVLLASLSVAVVAIAGLMYFPESLARDTRLSIWIAAILLPITGVSLVSGAVLQGLGRVLESQIPNTIFRPLIYAILLGGAIVLGRTLDAPSALLLNLVAFICALLLSLTLVRREMPALARQAAPAYETKAWLQASLAFVVISAFQLVISQQSDVLFVGMIIGKKGVGYYGAASQLSALVLFAATAISFIGSPMVAQLWARGEKAELQRLLRTISRMNLLLGAPLAAGLIIVGRFALSLFGSEWVHVYPVLVILACSQFVAAAIGSMAGMLLSMTGHQNAAVRMVGISALVNIALAIPLTKMFGLVGTASATIIATIVRSALLEAYSRRVMGLSLLPFSKNR